MDLTTFEAYAHTFGASLERWPHELRTEAEALLSTSESAQQALVRAGMLDRLLDQADPPFDATAFADRMVQQVTRSPARASLLLVLQRPQVLGAAIAFCLFLGVGLGIGETIAERRLMLLQPQMLLFGPDSLVEML